MFDTWDTNTMAYLDMSGDLANIVLGDGSKPSGQQFYFL